ncbi:hypothetical protein P9112_002211 [Eukaryota sp. TZLM1-RC]
MIVKAATSQYAYRYAIHGITLIYGVSGTPQVFLCSSAHLWQSPVGFWKLRCPSTRVSDIEGIQTYHCSPSHHRDTTID